VQLENMKTQAQQSRQLLNDALARARALHQVGFKTSNMTQVIGQLNAAKIAIDNVVRGIEEAKG
jgi:hypothetical protein